MVPPAEAELAPTSDSATPCESPNLGVAVDSICAFMAATSVQSMVFFEGSDRAGESSLCTEGALKGLQLRLLSRSLFSVLWRWSASRRLYPLGALADGRGLFRWIGIFGRSPPLQLGPLSEPLVVLGHVVMGQAPALKFFTFFFKGTGSRIGSAQPPDSHLGQ